MDLIKLATEIDHAIGDDQCIFRRIERVASMIANPILRLELRVIARLVAALEGCHR